jgi:hypothetical protein
VNPRVNTNTGGWPSAVAISTRVGSIAFFTSSRSAFIHPLMFSCAMPIFSCVSGSIRS